MIGILAAMPSEVEAIKERMIIDHEESFQNMNLIYGSIHEKEVVLALCGVGKCLAAMSATLLCVKEDLEALINVGVAGGLKKDQNVLDIVISNRMVQADYDTSPIDGKEGIGLFFDADETLGKTCEEACQNLGISYHVGMVASQDIFMARSEDFVKLMNRFPESACSEMEGGAIAQVAHKMNVPVLVIRSLSDVVNHEDNPMEFSTYEKLAAKQAASLVDEMLKA